VHAVGGAQIGNSPALPGLIVEETVSPGYGLVFPEYMRKPSFTATDDVTWTYHQVEAEVSIE
jgi:hypothetical protein